MRPLGFEPRTCGLRVRCSAIELEARAAHERNRRLSGHTSDYSLDCSPTTTAQLSFTMSLYENDTTPRVPTSMLYDDLFGTLVTLDSHAFGKQF